MLAVLLVIAVVVSFSYLRNLQTTFDENRNVIDGLDLEDDSAYRTPEGTINMLLMGTDSRGDDEDDYRDATGEGNERSDTMMFVHIPEDRSGVYVMSIMRDLWVEVPGEGMGRVNTALGLGGYDLAVDLVEEMLYTHIDHVAVVDFEGFSDLTEALGGVYVDNPHSFSAGQRNPAFYPEGTIRLEGSNALRYVRERQSFPRGLRPGGEPAAGRARHH
ncbi:LCP family protein [Nesterenkonia pannonica]|uniref:LCP family protein n=1 Tax=Nesterenkonia pannonica TaxID=1548602 RepID=UPI0021645870|nr:LCP family protein [Nesterenkonia pannonica]